MLSHRRFGKSFHRRGAVHRWRLLDRLSLPRTSTETPRNNRDILSSHHYHESERCVRATEANPLVGGGGVQVHGCYLHGLDPPLHHGQLLLPEAGWRSDTMLGRRPHHWLLSLEMVSPVPDIVALVSWRNSARWHLPRWSCPRPDGFVLRGVRSRGPKSLGKPLLDSLLVSHNNCVAIAGASPHESQSCYGTTGF